MPAYCEYLASSGCGEAKLCCFGSREDEHTEDGDLFEVFAVELLLCTMLSLRGHLIYVTTVDFS